MLSMWYSPCPWSYKRAYLFPMSYVNLSVPQNLVRNAVYLIELPLHQNPMKQVLCLLDNPKLTMTIYGSQYFMKSHQINLDMDRQIDIFSWLRLWNFPSCEHFFLILFSIVGFCIIVWFLCSSIHWTLMEKMI